MRALPNVIAVLRALAVAPVVVLIDRPDGALAALVLFALAATSDAVDGPLARRVGATSALGTFLDPLADKVLVLGTLGALVAHGTVDPLVVAVIFVREAIVTAARALAVVQGRSIGSSAYGKAKATLQAIAVGGQLLVPVLPGVELAPAAAAALALTSGVTVVTGLGIIRRAFAAAATAPAAAHADAR